MKTAFHPSGQTIYFDDTTHRYFVGDKILTSVTRFVHSFFPKFDAEGIAPRYAKKHQRTVDDVLAEWAREGELASDLGTDVHAFAENWWMPWEHEPISKLQTERKELYYRQADAACAKLAKRYDYVCAEMIVASPQWGIAGTIDLLLRRKDDSKQFLIVDWKTNKKIKQENNWGNTALPPIAYLDDCNFNEYKLQLNTYEFILIHENYFPGATYRKAVIHLMEDGHRPYPIENMQGEIITMLEWI